MPYKLNKRTCRKFWVKSFVPYCRTSREGSHPGEDSPQWRKFIPFTPAPFGISFQPSFLAFFSSKLQIERYSLLFLIFFVFHLSFFSFIVYSSSDLMFILRHPVIKLPWVSYFHSYACPSITRLCFLINANFRSVCPTLAFSHISPSTSQWSTLSTWLRTSALLPTTHIRYMVDIKSMQP